MDRQSIDFEGTKERAFWLFIPMFTRGRVLDRGKVGHLSLRSMITILHILGFLEV